MSELQTATLVNPKFQNHAPRYSAIKHTLVSYGLVQPIRHCGLPELARVTSCDDMIAARRPSRGTSPMRQTG